MHASDTDATDAGEQCREGVQLLLPIGQSTGLPERQRDKHERKQRIVSKWGRGLSTAGQKCIGVIVPLFRVGVSVILFVLKRRASKRKEEKGEAGEMEDEKQEKVEPISGPHLLGNRTSDDTVMLGQQAREKPVHELVTG